MILADTSVWIDHFRNRNAELEELLIKNEVMIHPFIIGELACGSIRNRIEILELLNEMPRADVAEHHEVLKLIEDRRLYGRGIGLIDVHLIASALITKVRLLTMDKALAKVLALMNI
jgi:predicted nucleic acid-binding protein